MKKKGNIYFSKKGTSLEGNIVAVHQTCLPFFRGILLMDLSQPPLQLEVVID